ncbi:MAG: RlmE family RNA methyltransferase [Deltaproteobacteria bacterium]|nr:RlmE family RNA methyltransferase [Deltaproteobacteria bacterium]MBW2136655.1 RlmE family RNA methyltransferase [Deltaproteobacteria bacterium]
MKKGNKWEDHYSRRAKQEKWLARSVYKLQEIDKRYRLVRRGDRVLDLGCYPGSWSQYLLKAAGKRGQVVGLDLLEPIHVRAANFRFIKGDIHSIDIRWLVEEIGPRDSVLSDLAPKTTGARATDAIRSLELAEKAMAIAIALLRHQGHFLCKVFEGEEVKGFREALSHYFGDTRAVRPAAVRKGSKEIYMLGLRFEGG